MLIQSAMTMEQKLEILGDAAKYDVSCSSSGVDRAGSAGSLGNCSASGICHTFTGDGRCISLLKILMTNECVFDCKYCINRASNDVVRAAFTPEEICKLTIQFYRRNYIEGLFLSSGVLKTPAYTMELLCKTLIMLRNDYGFNGYIHVKCIPGAPADLVEMAGWYADRVSVNLELPTADGLRALAPNKTRNTILKPMRQIQNGISESREQLGLMGGNRSAFFHTRKRLNKEGIGMLGGGSAGRIEGGWAANGMTASVQLPARTGLQFAPPSVGPAPRGFSVGGQSTQMIIGATQETDYQLIQVAESLYQHFDLKRVYYSAFVKVNQDSTLPDLPGGPPLLREHRLYQADWLFRYYGFTAGELLSEKKPNFNIFLDPKCDWAVQNLGLFPVEVATADYFTLLRVPGIGPKSAQRIVDARRCGKLSVESIRKMGVVWKRARFFVTCNGFFEGGRNVSEDMIVNCLTAEGTKNLPKHLADYGAGYKQLSLFDTGLLQREGIA